jgi:hypothetical protein
MNAQVVMKPEEGRGTTNQWLVFCRALRLPFLEERLETCYQNLKTTGQSSWLAVQAEGASLPTATPIFQFFTIGHSRAAQNEVVTAMFFRPKRFFERNIEIHRIVIE